MIMLDYHDLTASLAGMIGQSFFGGFAPGESSPNDVSKFRVSEIR